MLPEEKVGIIGWGSYIPRWRMSVSEIVRVWGFNPHEPESLAVSEKSVAGPDEDSVTMGWEAARNALRRAGVDPSRIGAVWFGTESKPYAVKPSATIIAEALGITPNTMASDLEFACRAASEALRISIGSIASGLIKYALIIGSDTAQANPGDVLEFTASSAATAIVTGPREEAAAYFEASTSFVTDTPDFWRRDTKRFPLHGEAFTGEPAYFHHIVGAVKALFEKTGLKPGDFDYAIFHQPNGTFPIRVARVLGIPKEKVLPGLVTPYIGNSYNSSALIGLSRVLDKAKPGERILLAPFGSGAGSDAYSIVVTDRVVEKQSLAPTVDDYLSRKSYVDYAVYARFRRLIERINTGASEPRIPPLWRTRIERYRLKATRCRDCGRVGYPASSTCRFCGSENIEYVELINEKARLVTWTVIYSTMDGFEEKKPVVIGIVETINSKARITAPLTDILLDELKPGLLLEPVLRRISEGGNAGLIHYGVSMRPALKQ